MTSFVCGFGTLSSVENNHVIPKIKLKSKSSVVWSYKVNMCTGNKQYNLFQNIDF